MKSTIDTTQTTNEYQQQLTVCLRGDRKYEDGKLFGMRQNLIKKVSEKLLVTQQREALRLHSTAITRTRKLEVMPFAYFIVVISICDEQ